VLLAVPAMTPFVAWLERLVARLVPGSWRRPARAFRWAQNIVIDAVPGVRTPPLRGGRPAEARLLDTRWKTTGGAGAGRRLRIGDYAEPPRAAASR
jgi:hypothetical protein